MISPWWLLSHGVQGENVVGLLGLLPLSRCDTDDRAFSGVKTHLPSLSYFSRAVRPLYHCLQCSRGSCCLQTMDSLRPGLRFSRTLVCHLPRLGITMAQAELPGVGWSGHQPWMNECTIQASCFLERHMWIQALAWPTMPYYSILNNNSLRITWG